MRYLSLSVLALFAPACDSPSATYGDVVPATTGQATGSTSGTVGETASSSTRNNTESTSDSVTGSTQPKYDVGGEQDEYCRGRSAGTYCTENTAITCDDEGGQTSSEACGREQCLEQVGCVICVAGQYSCLGDRVLRCDDVAQPPAWQEIATCETHAGQTCSASTGTCVDAEPIGFPCNTDEDCDAGQRCDTVPHQCITGVYYKFAEFGMGAGGLMRGGYDVDSWDDNIYITARSNEIDVYTVELMDSDMDGTAEPDQHPENPDNPGFIETRVLHFVETCGITSITCPVPVEQIQPSQAEIYALADRIYVGGPTLTEYPLIGGIENLVAMPMPQAEFLSMIGYDEIGQVWYGASENWRRVYQYNANTGTWGIAFTYPELSGDHMDGLEVVTQASTGIAYVYVSDMTSDYIAQYRADPELGWVQENLFSYQDSSGMPVEGMGFGAFNHFWATSGASLYEIGGGDITEFVEPPAG